MDYGLTKNDTLSLKGVGICGMLCWHLFFCPNPEDVIFSDFTKFIGVLGDVCVSIFLFVSGYGLSVGYSKIDNCEPKRNFNNIKFVVSRLLKFYFGFWFVFIVFVPLGVFVFDIPMSTSQSWETITKEWIRQFMGMAGFSAYNSNWWFNSLIIPLYVLFPLMYQIVKKCPIYTLLCVLILSSLKIRIGVDMGIYVLAFTSGIIYELNIAKLNGVLNKMKPTLVGGIVLSLILIACSFLYFKDWGGIYYSGIKCYWLLTVSLAVGMVFFRNIKLIYYVFRFLGMHSANIYMIHTLIFRYWFSEFFYSINCPLLIFLCLITITLLISIVMEKVKKLVGWNGFQKYITDKINVVFDRFERLLNNKRLSC